jgi:hypothetical protein
VAGHRIDDLHCSSGLQSRAGAIASAVFVEGQRSKRCQLQVQGREIMAEQEETASEKLVESVTLTLFSRVAMLFASGLIPPIALWLARGVATIDEISKKLDTMRDQVIETSAEIRAQQKMLDDHKMRVRLLEAAGRANPPIARP